MFSVSKDCVWCMLFVNVSILILHIQLFNGGNSNINTSIIKHVHQCYEKN